MASNYRCSSKTFKWWNYSEGHVKPYSNRMIKVLLVLNNLYVDDVPHDFITLQHNNSEKERVIDGYNQLLRMKQQTILQCNNEAYLGDKQ